VTTGHQCSDRESLKQLDRCCPRSRPLAVHVVLQHTLRTIEKVGEMSFVTCDIEQEEEADWLGGCLLVPGRSCSRPSSRGRPRRRSPKNM